MLREIAKNNGVSVAEVMREMRLAISAAYENPGPAALALPKKGGIPTPQEIIDYCVGEYHSAVSRAANCV